MTEAKVIGAVATAKVIKRIGQNQYNKYANGVSSGQVAFIRGAAAGYGMSAIGQRIDYDRNYINGKYRY